MSGDAPDDAMFPALTHVLFGFQGQIYRSPMPFGSRDPEGAVIGDAARAGVKVIVVLASVEECERKARCDLHAIYEARDFRVVACPVPDYEAPDDAPRFMEVLEEVERLAKAGAHVLVHCSAGQGRTGMFLACLAVRARGLGAKGAIDWVREFVPNAVETPPQRAFVREVATPRA
jgi:protein-tyrosine phosphatase